MPENAPQPASNAASPAGDKPAPRRKIRSNVDWGKVWPIPLLGVSVAALIGAMALAVARAPRVDPAAPLKFAEDYLRQGRHEDAIATLNQQLVAAINKGQLTEEQEREFYLLRARALAQAQQARNLSEPENEREILKAYAQADKIHPVTDPVDIARQAAALVMLERGDEALEMMRTLPESEAHRRVTLIEKIVEHNLSSKDVRYDQTLGLLTELMQNPELPQERRAWAVARQAELRLAMGYQQEAIARLLRAMPKFENLRGESRAELLYLLGKAYYQAEQFALAAKHLEEADRNLPPQSEMRGETGVMLAQILMSEQKPDQALDKFNEVVERYPDSKARLPALVGAGEACAVLDDHDTASEWYRQAIEEAIGGARRRDVTPESIAESLLARHRERYQRPDYPHALQYAQLAEKAYKRLGEPPAEITLALAESHRAMAEQILTEARTPAETHTEGHDEHRADPGDDLLAEEPGEPVHEPAPAPAHASAYAASGEGHPAPGEHEGAAAHKQAALHDGASTHEGAAAHEAGEPGKHAERAKEPARAELIPAALRGISPVSIAEIKRHLLDAAQYFYEHYQSMLVSDYARASEALWKAADCYDRAGDWREAAEKLSSYISGSKQDDPRVPEARFRLARVYRALGETEQAAAAYRELISTRTKGEGITEGGQASGNWADRSYVPLALCYLADADAENDAEAERLLREVVRGTIVSKDSPEYREALTELGTLASNKGDYAEAIGLLSEARESYPEHPRMRAVTFRLANAYRLSAQQISADLRKSMPLNQREELKRTRRERLKLASQMYQKLLDLHAGADHRTLTPLDAQYARNAMFYLGDMAFELEDYPAAIAAYDAARQKYAQDPSALLALTQIVSAYVHLENFTAAATANERARQALASVGDDVWDRPGLMLPMEKQHWERWLEAKAVLERRQQRADGSDAEH